MYRFHYSQQTPRPSLLRNCVNGKLVLVVSHCYDRHNNVCPNLSLDCSQRASTEKSLAEVGLEDPLG